MPILETERSPAFTFRSALESWGMSAFYVVFLALAIIPPLFYLRQPLLHDEMTYLVIGREIAAGGTLYAGIADHKTPAVYYLTALLWETVPEPYLAGRVLVYAVHAVTALLVFRLGSLWGRPVAAVGSLAYLFGVYVPVFDGFILMTEPFAALFLTAAVLWLFAERRVTDLLAGLSLAFGVLFNQTVLLFGIVVICWSLARLYVGETDLRTVAVRYGRIAVAFLTPLGLVALFAASRGTLAETLWYTFLLPLNHYDPPYFLDGQLLSAASYLPVWLLAGGTALYVFRSIPSRSFDTRLAFLSLWLVIMSVPGLQAFHGGHRYIFAMPAAAVLAGVGLRRLFSFLADGPRPLSRLEWVGLALAVAVSEAVLTLVAANSGYQYLFLLEFGFALMLVGAIVLSYVMVKWDGSVGQLDIRQWVALVAGVFLVLSALGGTVAVDGVREIRLSGEHIETQSASAEELDETVDGRFYSLGPPTRYELAYFGEARPARTFITPPYGEPLADRVVTELERGEVPYVLVKSQQVVDGRIDPTHGYYPDAREPVVMYIEANYEPVAEHNGYVVYERVPDRRD
ncbi:ArnT family glycosyltransferase [Haloarcula sebkhae]|uniref:Glycosyltransferase RgtA/B/C/D-like domain-containing protein n=2 Tax=Haloarcula sebkhae TaxID=932660 RepID=A0A830EV07_9EURY|nr:hypothetical protein [Haloarcula sebkhae]GGK77120.1 hypothetical protein GCM10009067_31920 [Haloarcula sebkhae]